MKKADLMTLPSAEAKVPEIVRCLAPWFHNLHLPNGSQTAPEHPLGDFPRCKWEQLNDHLPKNLFGWTALDVGCNAGFYTIELARRGADVTAIDKDPHFLRQTRWALRQFGLEGHVNVHRAQVYDLARDKKRFDLVLFMGVFYHLRYPLLALDILAARTRKLMVFQTLTHPGNSVKGRNDLHLGERCAMLSAGWPKMAFIENSLAGDPTNWWAPNHACVEALLRSTGMRRVRRIGHEIYLCHPPDGKIAEFRNWDPNELASATGDNNRRVLFSRKKELSRTGLSPRTPRRTRSGASSPSRSGLNPLRKNSILPESSL